MPTETCAICAATVSFDATVHLMINPIGGDGVEDYYVCRSCYDERVADLFERPAT